MYERTFFLNYIFKFLIIFKFLLFYHISELNLEFNYYDFNHKIIIYLLLLNSLLICLDIIIIVLIRVAFLTLLERKILSYIQLRKGPNKVGFIGLLQPFSDAIKLFRKENNLVLKSNYFIYLICPIFILICILIIWQNIPILSKILSINFSLLIILCIISLNGIFFIFRGWFSNSKYSIIGRIRALAQTISYEIVIILIILNLILLVESFNFYKFIFLQKYIWFFLINFFLILIFYVVLLAELNRTPFDISEGESELVSGFNIEYIRGRFAIIFISEYGIIIFNIFIFIFFFLGGKFIYIRFYLIYLILLFLIIWIRGTLPRIRYDNLIYLTWKSYLPLSLNYIIIILILKLII